MFKFYDSRTKESKGESIVIIKYKGDYFSGRAYKHPDDEWSELTGCRYAEKRAEIKALKAEHKAMKKSCDECRKFVNAVSCYKNFDRESPTAKAMFRQLNRRIKAVNKLADLITKKEFELRVAINQQDKVGHRFGQKKTKATNK